MQGKIYRTSPTKLILQFIFTLASIGPFTNGAPAEPPSEVLGPDKNSNVSHSALQSAPTASSTPSLHNHTEIARTSDTWLSPSFFYSIDEPVIVCPESTEMFRMDSIQRFRFRLLQDTGQFNPPSEYRVYRHMYQNWWGPERVRAMSRGNPNYQRRMLRDMNGYIRRCRQCYCIWEEERQSFRLDGSPLGDPDNTAYSCGNPTWIDMCTNKFGCYCAPRLKNPDPLDDTDITVEDYQDAIDHICPSIAAQNPNWVYGNGPRHPNGDLPGFQSGGYGYERNIKLADVENFMHLGPSEYRRQQERWAAPGTKEPYYLEGIGRQGSCFDDTQDAIARMNELGRALFKRDVEMKSRVEVEDTDKVDLPSGSGTGSSSGTS
ncbi:hypothetical protein TWF718_001079 [Orbilia javanica]|uniref:Uncharacterized protein n=1 Tax=Orbilia javanica TaxID=47235 RepID=A0AAN8MUW6_9PEZI